MCGGKTEVFQPTPPPQPSTADAIREYAAVQPLLFEQQLEFAPREAQLQLDLARQFAGPSAQLMKEAQETLFPGTSALQEKLAGQALQRIEQPFTPEEEAEALDIFRSNLGTNIGSPIGASAITKDLLGFRNTRQQEAVNLGLSLAGRQPLPQPATPATSNFLGSFTPGQALGFQQGTFGAFSQASRPFVDFGGGQFSLGPLGKFGQT